MEDFGNNTIKIHDSKTKKNENIIKISDETDSMQEESMRQDSMQQDSIIIDNYDSINRVSTSSEESFMEETDSSYREETLNKVHEMKETDQSTDMEEDSQLRISGDYISFQYEIASEMKVEIYSALDKKDSRGEYTAIVNAVNTLFSSTLRYLTVSPGALAAAVDRKRILSRLLGRVEFFVDKYINSHGSVQFTSRGKKRNKAVRSVRKLVKQMYELFDAENEAIAKEEQVQDYQDLEETKIYVGYNYDGNSKDLVFSDIEKEELSFDLKSAEQIVKNEDITKWDVSDLAYNFKTEKILSWMKSSIIVNGASDSFKKLFTELSLLFYHLPVSPDNYDIFADRVNDAIKAYQSTHINPITDSGKMRLAFCKFLGDSDGFLTLLYATNKEKYDEHPLMHELGVSEEQEVKAAFPYL